MVDIRRFSTHDGHGIRTTIFRQTMFAEFEKMTGLPVSGCLADLLAGRRAAR